MQSFATLVALILDATAAGRALLLAANAAAQRTALGLGTAAQSATGDFDAAGSAAAAQSHAVQRANHTGTQAISTVTGLQSALDDKAPLASPALTGTPTAPTAIEATNNTQLATTAFVHALITSLIGTSPSALDTLGELADALGDDANFAATVTTALSGKLAKASNLSDLTNAGTARSNLGLVIGTDVQAQNAQLAAIAVLTTTSFGRSLLELSNAAALLSAAGAAAASHTHAQSDITNLVSDLAAKIAASIIDAKGDLIVGTAADTPARLAVGVDGQVLTADSAQTAGVKWATPSAGVADMPVSSKSGDYTLLAADKGKLISFTATATAGLTAAATLGAGWWAIIENAITGNDPASQVTIDPNSTEQCDGLSTVTQYVGERRLIQCDGSGFTSRILRPHRQIVFSSSGSYIVPPDNRGVALEVIGGGGSGGGGTGAAAGNLRSGGSGGGGGACHAAEITSAALGSPGTSITVTVGAQTSAPSAGANGSAGNTSSFGTLCNAYGGGAGQNPGSSNRGGGSGGGVAGAGQPGANANVQGGLPGIVGSSTISLNGMGGGGAGSGVMAGGFGEYGGGGGGAVGNTPATFAGGGSQHGGAGGGAGGCINASNATTNSTAGGQTGPAAASSGSGGGAGTSGATATAGTAGADGTDGACGQGGGGGGADTDSTGGAGGDGGAPGGGGGGGGGGTSTGGAGGRGARGEVRVRGL